MITAQDSNTEDSVGQTVDAVNTWWDNPATREWLIDKPIEIGITLIVALIAHWGLRKLIDRLARRSANKKAKLPAFAPFGRRSREEEEASAQMSAMRKAQEGRRQARVHTLADVGKSAVGIFVWLWAFLAILQTLGVNIAPLLASAGVAGVALGFGAQSLVKDFLSGIFMLLEDQYGVGDTVDVGDGIIGDVEEVTLRVTTIRDIDGTLWYVRNGEILRIGNYSDEFSIARIQVPVGLSNDAEKAADVILSSAQKTVQDEAVSDAVIDEPVLNGVTDFDVDHLSFRVSVKTLPGQQWAVQRLIMARVLQDMQAAGITTPYPHGIGAQRPGDFDI
ncbi:mechanosensitive ion channel family protein [Corynebacterium halotolerans]|uniref:Small-conductance mechanosensitive channel n=1 Tax=Corynebacterium halotolerans YIM 70093 = DSM 44683 TaxID=1121362 RepID=M1P9A4_9CORY|nr:mechanosensitive ion channel family protein [Corynebacterium halotolerans]AGF73261.1 hypothetical protein A605_11305 [Corynebacterium halotolerans YIM 70093 = DSM 44683]